MKEMVNSSILVRIAILVAIFAFLAAMCSFGHCAIISSAETSLVAMLPKAIIIALVFVFVKLITSSLKLLNKKRGKETVGFGLINIIRYGLWAVFVVMSLSIIFGDIGALLTSLGLIGFGVTFALQKPILNFVGWFHIHTHKTFSVGDRIKIKELSGDVIDIKMMHTVIRSLLAGTDQHSGKLVSVPNELFLVEPVENYTMDNNFIKSDIKMSITYESDWRRAKDIFEDIVTNVTKKNIHSFKENLNKKISIIESSIEKMSGRLLKSKSKEREEKIKEHIGKLEREKEDIEDTFDEIPARFKPMIFVDTADSAIVLSSIFVAPFDSVRSVKTEINSAFLDAIRRERGIEIAYPHLKILTKSRPGMSDHDLSKFLGISEISPDSIREEDTKKPPKGGI